MSESIGNNSVSRSGIFDRLNFAFLTLESRRANQIAYGFIALSTLLNLFLVLNTSLTLAPDEAHYWEWSRRLDLAYYSKGPLIALLIRFGCEIFGENVLGIRSVAIIFQAATLILFFQIVRLWVTPGVAVVLLFAFRSTLMISSLGLVATTDPPTAFFWLAAIGASIQALRNPKWWVISGVCVGIAFLGKYTSAVLGVSLLCFIVHCRREDLRTIWPYLGGVVALASAIPVLIWNVRHDWVNFAHNLNHIRPREVGSGGWNFNPAGVIDLFGSQLGLYGPVIAGMLILVGFTACKRFSVLNDSAKLLLYCAAPVILVCIAVAITRRVYANWPMPGFLALFLLLALRLREVDLRFTRTLVIGTAINYAILLPVYFIFTGATFGLSGNILPTKKLVGWDLAGEHAEKLARNFFYTPPTIVAENYDSLSSLVFAMPSHPKALCAVTDSRRMNQYDLWGGWSEEAGRDLLIVSKEGPLSTSLAKSFGQIEQLPPLDGLPILLGRTEVRRIYFYRGENYSGDQPPKPGRR